MASLNHGSRLILSKNFVIFYVKIFDKIIFHSREKTGLEIKENGLKEQKTRVYFSKP